MTTPSENGAPAGLASRAATVPQRDLRLLVDGIREWLSSLRGRNCPPGLLGVLEGESGQGQTEILGALRHVCHELGMAVVSGRAYPAATMPPGAMTAMCGEALLFCEGKETTWIDGVDRAVLAGVSAPASKVLLQLPAAGAPLSTSDPASMPSPGGQPSCLRALEPELDRSRLVDAMARTLLQVGTAGPIFVILEDLQAGDALTIETLRQLLRMLWLRRQRGEGSPILFFILTVPEGERVEELLGSRDVRTKDVEVFRIHARGYSRDDLREVALKLLGEKTPLSFRERIFRFAHGNVRHIRWLLWHMKESGGYERLNGRASDLDWSFPRLVEERFRALDEEEKLHVGVLAALGVPCPGVWAARVVESLKKGGEGSLIPEDAGSAAGAALESLCRKEWALLVRPQGEEEGPRYVIADGDIADVVLQGLDAAARKKLYETLGTEIFKQAEKDASWLPHAFKHFRLAQNTKKCLQAARGAASYFESLGYPEEALKIIKEYLQDAPTLELVNVKLQAASLFEKTGRYHRALDLYREVLELEVEAEQKGLLHRRMGDVHGKLGDRESQVEEYKAGLASLTGEDAAAERLRLLSALASVHLEIDQLDESVSYLDQCDEILAREKVSSGKEWLEVSKISVDMSLRRKESGKALQLEQAILKECEENGDILGQVDSLSRLSHLHALLEQWELSESSLVKSMELGARTGSRCLVARALSSLGRFHRDQKSPQAALKQLLEARDIFDDLGQLEAVHSTGSSILGLELELGQFASAGKSALAFVEGSLALEKERTGEEENAFSAKTRRERLKQVEKALEAPRSSSVRLAEMLTLGRLLEDEGRLKDAQRLYQISLQLEGAKNAGLRSRALHSLARLAALKGEDDAALHYLEEGLQANSCPSRQVLVDAYLGVSAIFLGRGDFARSIDYGLRGLRLALEAGEAEDIVRSFMGLSDFLIEVGIPTVGADMARGAAMLARARKLLRSEVAVCRNLVRTIASELTEELPGGVVPRWLELCKWLDCPLETGRLKLELGWQRYNEHAFEDALCLAREGLEIARLLEFHPLLDELLLLLGVVESASHNPRKNLLRALEALEQARQGAESRNRPRLRWEVFHALSALYLKRGKKDLAAEYFERAQEIQRKVSSTLPPALGTLEWTPRAQGADLGEPFSKPQATPLREEVEKLR